MRAETATRRCAGQRRRRRRSRLERQRNSVIESVACPALTPDRRGPRKSDRPVARFRREADAMSRAQRRRNSLPQAARRATAMRWKGRRVYPAPKPPRVRAREASPGHGWSNAGKGVRGNPVNVITVDAPSIVRTTSSDIATPIAIAWSSSDRPSRSDPLRRAMSATPPASGDSLRVKAMRSPINCGSGFRLNCRQRDSTVTEFFGSVVARTN